MRFGWRDDKDQGPTRVVIWSKSATHDYPSSDLSVVVAVLLAVGICGASIVCAIEFAGVTRVIAVALAVVSGLWVVMIFGSMIIGAALFGWLARSIERWTGRKWDDQDDEDD